MPAPQDIASPLNSAAGSGSVRRLVRFLPCATGDDRQPVRLLPSGRFTPAILPIVGSATRAACGGDDLGGGVVREVGGEGHGQTIHRKNKSAMPKIILAKSRQCRHIDPAMTFSTADLKLAKDAAKQAGIALPKLDTTWSASCQGRWYFVWDGSRIAWEGTADNASDAKSKAIWRMVDESNSFIKPTPR